jgi:hypothetical protein
VLLDLTGDGKPEIVLVGAARGPSTVMGENAKGQWQVVATLPYDTGGCGLLRDALVAGNVRAVPRALGDIEIGGQRVQVSERRAGPPECGKK